MLDPVLSLRRTTAMPTTLTHGLQMRSRFWMVREIEAILGSAGIAAFF